MINPSILLCKNVIGRRNSSVNTQVHPGCISGILKYTIDQDRTCYRAFLRPLPVSQRPVLAGAPSEAGVGGVGGAGQVDGLSAPAAASRCRWGHQRHQGGVAGAESQRGLAEWNLAAAAARLTAVCLETFVNAHLGDGHAQHGLQLQDVK